MEDNELIEKIKWLNDPNGGNISMSLLAGVDGVFINLPQNKELKDAFKLSKYRENGWKWHQLVRVVLEPPETKQYMYDRLLAIILKHRRSYEDYFEIKNDVGVFRIPNPLADLNKLEILYMQYFTIYKKIVDEIHFDYPRIEYYGSGIRGKIDWTKTLTKSPMELPLAFSASVRKREFDTPENILLLLCAEWMCRGSIRLLHTQFLEPLTDYKIQLLKGVVQKTRGILQRFPLPSVLNASRKYWDLSHNDTRIKNLEDKTRRRINQNLVRNPTYSLLLNWVEEFRQLNMSSISEKTPSRHIIEPIENLDTIYEIWIFMEVVEFLFEKGLLVDFQLGNDPHCKFEFNGHIVIFWYEKEFAAGGPNAWIQRHKPDFTAMIDNEIIAIFDAKNYSKSSSISETRDKMLAYMTNLDANFGALIYPNHPKNWDDLNRNERIETMIQALSRQNPEKSEHDMRKMARSLADLSWNQLPKEYQDISPPANMEKYEYPGPSKKARYHLNQTLCLIRMPPTNAEQSISMKKKSLNSIFEEIVSRVPIKLESHPL